MIERMKPQLTPEQLAAQEALDALDFNGLKQKINEELGGEDADFTDMETSEVQNVVHDRLDAAAVVIRDHIHNLFDENKAFTLPDTDHIKNNLKQLLQEAKVVDVPGPTNRMRVVNPDEEYLDGKLAEINELYEGLAAKQADNTEHEQNQ